MHMKKLMLIVFPCLLLASCQNDAGTELGPELSVNDVVSRAAEVPARKNVREEIKPAAPRDSVNVGKFKFEMEEHDFGTITEGEEVAYSFKFKNEGVAPLVISDARGSCGCTVPQWPKEPIPPGEEGKIDVVFNSKGKKGNQRKSVTLTANTWPQEKTVVYIKGKVEPDPNAAKKDQ